ncbi:MAG: adenosylcobinamide-phosphate synthase CbiB [Eubacteriaceae bacterium]|nr:adenosylcobinamide-phosphate synthase CbiB [Eubacteriaceae bacterium]
MIFNLTPGWWLCMILAAVVLDWIVGDPETIPHPIVWIGKSVGFLTKKLNRGNHRKGKGLLMWMIVMAITAAVVLALEYAALRIHWLLFVVLTIWFLATTLAEKSLKLSVKKVGRALEQDDLEEGRKQVGYLVGRDTTQLSSKEIIRATVETTAENTVDGVLAPLFYMVVGTVLVMWIPALNPLVLAMLYKAVNTMDSMVGYKQEPFTEFGFFPATLDDLFNFLIARLGSLVMILAGFFLGYDAPQASRIYNRDRYNHKSPNSAHPESVVAGLLGIQIGGTNIYFGETVVKPTIGDPEHELCAGDIDDTLSIMMVSEMIMAIMFCLGLFIVETLGG